MTAQYLFIKETGRDQITLTLTAASDPELPCVK